MLKSSVISIFLIFMTNICFAGESDNYKNKRIELMQEKYVEKLELIENGLEGDYLDNYKELINEFEKQQWTGVNSQLEKINNALSEGNDIYAKQLADKAINSGELSYKEIAFMHNAFGNYYFQINELEKAKIEFEKILKLPVNKSSEEARVN